MKIAVSLIIMLTGLAGNCRAQNMMEWETQLRESLEKMSARLASTISTSVVPDKVFRVEDFGAVGDGQSINSQAINRAIMLKDSDLWRMQEYANCEEVIVQNITVANPSREGGDGINMHGCRNVIIRGCLINAESNALEFTPLGSRSIENVLVEDCKFFSNGAAIKWGNTFWKSSSIFRNVLIRNVTLGGPSQDMPSRRTGPSQRGIDLSVTTGD